MNDRQKMFCLEYLKDLNATQAAIRAGYSKITAPNASRWLDEKDTKNYKPEMAQYIKERTRTEENKKIMQVSEILERLSEIAKGGTTGEVIVNKGVGDGCTEIVHVQKKPTSGEQIKALELLGKYNALFTEKQQIEAEVKPSAKFADIITQLKKGDK